MEAFLDEAFSSSEGRKEQEKQFPAWWCSYSYYPLVGYRLGKWQLGDMTTRFSGGTPSRDIRSLMLDSSAKDPPK